TTTEFAAINATHVPFITGNKYSYMPPVPTDNDLAALTVSGNTTPSIGNVTNYTVRIRNRGTNNQNNYQVKLIDTDNVELASVNGPAIASGEVLDVVVPWTPSVQGPVALRGKVALAGDELAINDISGVLNITVMPAGMIVVTVGDGSLNSRMPFDFYYRNSLYESLYYPAEMGAFGNITALTLYNQFTTTTLTNTPVKIWMGSTNLNDLSAGYIPSSELTLVYDGMANFPAGENNVVIPLQTMYSYTGGNLVVLFNRPFDAGYFSSADYFKCQTVGTNRARNVYSDSTTYDPANPGAVGTVSGTFPKTTFHMTPLSPDPYFSITPGAFDYGINLIETTHNQTFTITNAGGGTLTVSDISIAGSPFYTLQNLPTLPVNLGTGQTANFVVRYLPTAEGTQTATITLTSNMAPRTTHTVQLTGQCIDTNINTLPYVQNFDAVTAPALPLDWNALIQPPSTSAVVVTYTSSPHTNPNCVRIYNGSTTGTSVMLVAPPLSTTIPINTTRLRFWVKGVGATYSLSVGVLTDPLDASTYTEVQNFLTPTVWTEFVIPFNGYAGTGRTIAIKHGFTSTGQTIYVDDAEIELIAAHDLAVTSLLGNITPSVGNAATYTANVFNWGFNPESTYQVKLFNANDVELAVANGGPVDPGETVEVPLQWTPATEGPTSLYAKVFLTGDQNTTNDQSPSLGITVMPAGMMVVTVGDGSVNARMPLDMFYRNSIYETLYYPAELSAFGTISAITLYNNFSTNLPQKPTKIWMGTTQLNDLSADWIPATQLIQVFDGNVDYPSGQNSILIPLQVPFTYSGGNLVVMFNRPLDTTYFSSTDYFKGQVVGTNRARNIYADSTTYDPNAPTGGTVTGHFPQTTFHMSPLSDDPVFIVSPAT
ncbi:MAG: hypothetical protein PHI68_08715, partial [Candidatus Cloacimonetes bacterium]|nr:hypothetical protein [Candidatus Cloacimonadota bacterium]